MSPSRLLHLAQKSLLGNETLAILSLEQLPREMFPALFLEAFNRRLLSILKAMVRVWPFEFLPLGALMKSPQVDILKAVLDGLDLLCAQKSHSRRLLSILKAMVRVWPFEFLPLGDLMEWPQVDILNAVLDGLDMKYIQKSDCRRGKLHVLDLRDAGLNFWKVWAECTDDACSPEPKVRRQPVEHKGPKSALKVIANVNLTEDTPDEFLTHLFQWVKERASLVHLCCHNLMISPKNIHSLSKILDILELGCIQEVQVDSVWQLSALAKFAPYLGRMGSLHNLCVSHLWFPTPITPKEKVQFNSHFSSKLAKMPHLCSLHMDSVDFLEDNLDQVLRCLKNPLEALSVMNCLLSESDIHFLSQCPKLSELKHLHLSGVKLTHISPEPLRVLLERVAANLLTLDLMGCEITDSHLNAILPALSQCYQLTTLSFYGNRISMAMMEELVEHTGNLSALRVEQYPAPLEIYNTQGIVQRERFFHLCRALMGMLKRIREPKKVMFSTDPCGNSAKWMVFYQCEPNFYKCYLLE
ncbi:PRAME family member 8-like [Ochotona princeps]|uniref:PRAME family member 8-like n=1 Tax=Ochotona princeps TaxID=9978 RepID=UPI0027147E1D|nr:PRAME family member 8-like [Ochotona princeps]